MKADLSADIYDILCVCVGPRECFMFLNKERERVCYAIVAIIKNI